MRCLKQIFHKHKKLLKSIIGYVNMTLVNINIGAAVCALFQASKYSVNFKPIKDVSYVYLACWV